MNSFVKLLGGIALLPGMGLSAHAIAEPEIAIDFESDAQSGGEFISAQTGFHARRAAIWNVIDYRAIISVGVPALFAPSYKKKFICEFLNSIKERVITSADTAPAIALAAK
jgi:hypothetical protein